MKTKKGTITVQQFQDAASLGGGWGYWGHENRTKSSDKQIVKEANSIQLPFWILCSYADSRNARHFMDQYSFRNTKFELDLKRWELEINTWTPKEIQNEKTRFIPQSIQYILEE